MSLRVNINADLGEGMGSDTALLALIDTANIACGLHAGDPETMAATLRAAARHDVEVGAHPSYPDREGFGRRPMDLPPEAIEAVLATQIDALVGIAAAQGGQIFHVKPHGALSNRAAEALEAARAVARAVKAAGLVLLAPSGSAMVSAADELSLPVVEEVFADRGYDPSGNLLPRDHPQAFLHDPAEGAERVLGMIRQGRLVTACGTSLPCRAQSVCVHGDGPRALDFARTLVDKLKASNVKTCSLKSMLCR